MRKRTPSYQQGVDEPAAVIAQPLLKVSALVLQLAVVAQQVLQFGTTVVHLFLQLGVQFIHLEEESTSRDLCHYSLIHPTRFWFHHCVAFLK